MHATGRARVIATIVSAFADDPVERWMFPEDDAYLAHFPAFVAAFAGEAFSRGTVHESGDRSAVAVWLPPGAVPDGEAIESVLSRGVAPAKHADTFAVLGQMDAAHPDFPHWYLPWLGVRRDLRGHGHGGELLRDGLARVDADRLPAYLETPNPRTVPFYERHGFAVVGVARAGACPPVTLMLRPAMQRARWPRNTRSRRASS
jgi:ribosomal protein S18 acetylase RimI-like enzyme